MADKVLVGENTPEEVAYKLLRHISNCEKRSLDGGSGNGYTPADRKWILETYGKCITTIRQGWHEE